MLLLLRLRQRRYNQPQVVHGIPPDSHSRIWVFAACSTNATITGTEGWQLCCPQCSLCKWHSYAPFACCNMSIWREAVTCARYKFGICFPAFVGTPHETLDDTRFVCPKATYIHLCACCSTLG